MINRIFIKLFTASFISFYLLSGAFSCGTQNDDDEADCSLLPITKADPKGGNYPLTDAPNVTLTANKPAIIYYSLDERTPQPDSYNTYKGSSPIYDIPIERDSILLFFAIDACGNQESVKGEIFRIDESPVSSASPPGGTYTAPVDVTI